MLTAIVLSLCYYVDRVPHTMSGLVSTEGEADWCRAHRPESSGRKLGENSGHSLLRYFFKALAQTLGPMGSHVYTVSTRL